ncbi:MAG: hypothetical protein GY934_02260 [Gammaproteobacteria bacterium]|nr:hypothetical protein [Gammaproteobacteria bacterium]
MSGLLEQLALKLLDWPFLLFTGIGTLIFIFKTEFSKIISHGGITLTWGDKSFEISELPEQLNENFAPVSDDIEELKARIKILEEARGDAHPSEPKEQLDADQTESAKKRMLEALTHGNYRWRSIERLASIANISTKQAEDILRPLDEVVFSVGKSGRTIARLYSR